MKRIILSILLMFTAMLRAQSTSVTATITDSPDGVLWKNGTVTATFAPGPPQAYKWTGGAIPASVSAQMNGSGIFTMSLPDNKTVSPSGSAWNFTICPNASSGCVSLQVPVTGASENLSASLSAVAKSPRFPASFGAYGYADSEIWPTPLPGGSYWNVTTSVRRQWTGTAWQTAVGSGTPASPLNSVQYNNGGAFGGTNVPEANTVLAGLSAPIYSTPTFVQGVIQEFGPVSTGTVHFTSPVTAGDSVIVLSNCRNAGSPPLLASSLSDGASETFAEVYAEEYTRYAGWVQSSVGGFTSITAATSGTACSYDLVIVALEYENLSAIDLTGSVSSESTAPDTPDPANVNITTTAPQDLVLGIGAYGAVSGSTVAVTAGFTERENLTASSYSVALDVEDQVVSSAGLVGATSTATGASNGNRPTNEVIEIAFKATSVTTSAPAFRNLVANDIPASLNPINGLAFLEVNSSGGNGSIGIGEGTFPASITAQDNLAVGDLALANVTTGSYANVAIGNTSMLDTTSGVNNVAVGVGALQANVAGSSNVAIGIDSLSETTSATGENVAIGGDSMYAHNLGNNNIGIGSSVEPSADDDNYEIVIGSRAVGNGSNTTTIGTAGTTKATYIVGGLANGVSTTTNTDNRGSLSLGSGGGTATYNFTAGPLTGAWTTAPICFAFDLTQANQLSTVMTVTTSSITIANSVGTGDTYTYHCDLGN